MKFLILISLITVNCFAIEVCTLSVDLNNNSKATCTDPLITAKFINEKRVSHQIKYLLSSGYNIKANQSTANSVHYTLIK